MQAEITARACASGVGRPWLAGLGCYVWLVPGSGLSDHAQGFYLGGACGITAGGLGLLIRSQWMLRHPEKWRKARIQETDERNQRITAQAAQMAGVSDRDSR